MNDERIKHRKPSLPRVAVLSESYLPQTGGTPTQIRALAAGLRREGFGIMIITRRLSSQDPKYELMDGVPVRRIGPSGTGPGRKWGMVLTAFRALLKFRKEYDLIYVPGFRVIGMAAVIASKMTGRRTVFRSVSCGEMSGAFFDSGIAGQPALVRFAFRVFSRLRECLLRRDDCFVAISTPIYQELIDTGVPTERIAQISNGIDVDHFAPVEPAERLELRAQLGFDEHAFVALYTGRLVRYKGLFTLVDVWEIFLGHHPGALLCLVGAGSNDSHNCEQDLRALVVERGLDESILFAGEVPNVRDHLCAADCFVFPTEEEAFGISLIEAMAAGLPVVATAVGGISDFLIDRENGLQIAPGDCEGMAAGLEELYSSSDLRARLGRAGRAMVCARFSQDAIDRQYAKLFCTLDEE